MVKVAVDMGFDRAITDALLKRLGWREKNLIDFSVTSDEVALGRPYADMIFRAMKEPAYGNREKWSRSVIPFQTYNKVVLPPAV